ncbi:MAG TPA: response regulator transcription factor [Woeseiaceae bacterium]|jgi:AraC-like DNA-binding protein|nr:response regulator transcription factor [Woeseiaceae bacterium]
MKEPVLLWVDLTVSSQHAELPDVFTEACEITVCTNPMNLFEEIARGGIHAVCFDMDYPDRHGLDLLRKTKAEFPGVPILFITLQHSEALAVWAFRNRVLDYLVKPVSRREFQRPLETLLNIGEVSVSQRKRQPFKMPAPIPSEIPHKARLSGLELLPAIYYVKRKFREKISATVVAQACGMDAFRFSRAFHAAFGLTFRDYVLRYRILEACRLLCDANGCVTDVAFSVGFNDASYFSRVFRRLIGISPSAYCAEFDREHVAWQVSSMRSMLKLPAVGWPE